MNFRRGSGTAPADQAFSLGATLKGSILALVIAFAGMALLGLVYSLSNWEGLPSYLQGFNYVSAAVGGVYVGRSTRRLGWLHGGAVGVIYMVLVAITLGGEGSLVSRVIDVRTVYAALAGAIGGMLGVNLR